MTPNPGEIRRNSPEEQHEYGEFTLVGNDSNGRPRIEHTDSGAQFAWTGSEWDLVKGGLDLNQNAITNVKYTEVTAESDIPSSDTGWFYVSDVENLVYKHE